VSDKNFAVWWTYPLISPIDFGWGYLRTVDDVGAQIAREQLEGKWIHKVGSAYSFEEFSSAWEQALMEAKAAGWEGDFKYPPLVFWLPSDLTFVYGFVFSNTGDTFVVSPVALPWLEERVAPEQITPIGGIRGNGDGTSVTSKQAAADAGYKKPLSNY
jgi:hypothetical protein